jgi:hypothetical protein
MKLHLLAAASLAIGLVVPALAQEKDDAEKSYSLHAANPRSPRRINSIWLLVPVLRNTAFSCDRSVSRLTPNALGNRVQGVTSQQSLHGPCLRARERIEGLEPVGRRNNARFGVAHEHRRKGTIEAKPEGQRGVRPALRRANNRIGG